MTVAGATRGEESTGARTRLLAGLPVAERRVRLAGVATAMLEGGAGPPLILLHGGIECGGPVWAPVIASLAERHRLVVPDLPGLGASDPVARLDAATFASWSEALLVATAAERPTLVAHSLGASLAARFAAVHGHRLGRLVLYGAPSIGPYRMPKGLLLTAALCDVWPSQRNKDRFARWALYDLERTRRRHGAWWTAFDAENLARGRLKHVKRTLRRLIRDETKALQEEALRRIAVPTALLWGRHDRMVPLRLAEDASARFGWPLRIVEDTGHVPHVERSGAFLRALDDLVGDRG